MNQELTHHSTHRLGLLAFRLAPARARLPPLLAHHVAVREVAVEAPNPVKAALVLLVEQAGLTRLTCSMPQRPDRSHHPVGIQRNVRLLPKHQLGGHPGPPPEGPGVTAHGLGGLHGILVERPPQVGVQGALGTIVPGRGWARPSSHHGAVGRVWSLRHLLRREASADPVLHHRGPDAWIPDRRGFHQRPTPVGAHGVAHKSVFAVQTNAHTAGSLRVFLGWQAGVPRDVRGLAVDHHVLLLGDVWSRAAGCGYRRQRVKLILFVPDLKPNTLPRARLHGGGGVGLALGGRRIIPIHKLQKRVLAHAAPSLRRRVHLGEAAAGRSRLYPAGAGNEDIIVILFFERTAGQ
mmetsp:Transcript_93355/g.249988  ORF Transcript_93355/g.249988 Transcript_93355/m.249988 type:complete len:349 (-) Transcript_93355:13-1059(-)